MLTLIAVFAPLLGAILAGVARPFIGKTLAVWSSILFMVVSAVAGVATFTNITFTVTVVPLISTISWLQSNW